MCRPASFVQTIKSKLLWSKVGDSHALILQENGVRDDGDIAKLELVPPGGDYSLPFNRWEFSVDGPRPDWFDADLAEKACREALPAWARPHFLPANGEFTVGPDMTRIVLSGAPVIAQSGGEIWTFDSSAPVITQLGGGIWTFDSSAPVITQSGGEIRACHSSAPVITKIKAQYAP
ncbi:MAG: hypothetical protein KGJ13_10250 [Patescibacteria group bacterium]|nr:hypothetical protein [Patescibacteria group bacterium]